MQANLSNSTSLDPIDALSASDLADATQAEALNNNFIERQQQLLYTDPDAFYGKQGEDALTATPGILDRLQDLRQEMLDVAPTPGIRQRLTRSLDGHMAFTRDNVLRHTRREAKAYQAATAQKRIDLLGTQAALDYSDPESVATYAEAAAHAGRAQALATDSDPDDTIAAAASSVWRNAIAGALARNDANTASALHRQAADALRPADAAALANQMAAAQENLTGQTYAAGLPLPSPDPAAPLDAEQALADIDAAHQAATVQNATDHGDSPSQQATNQHFIDIRFGNARRDVEQSGADLDQAVNNWLDQPDTDGTPQTERPPLGLWTRLLPDVQHAIDTVLSRNALPLTLTASGTSALPNTSPDIDEIADAIWDAVKSQGGRLAKWAARAIAARIFARAIAAAGAVAAIALPLIVIPRRIGESTILPLGDNARARIEGDDRRVTLEVREGDRWVQLPVEGRSEIIDGHRVVTIDPDRLRTAVSPETFDRIIHAPGVVVPPARSRSKPKSGVAPLPRPDLPPPPIPWIIKMDIGTSTDGGITLDIQKNATEEDAKELCPNYDIYLEIALRAAATAKAAGMINGMGYGKKVHRLSELEIRDMLVEGQLKGRGIREVKPEAAIKNGESPSYSKGSSRLDVMEIHDDQRTICVFDFKTGGATMDEDTMKRYAKEAIDYANAAHGGGYTHVYVIPVHVP